MQFEAFETFPHPQRSDQNHHHDDQNVGAKGRMKLTTFLADLRTKSHLLSQEEAACRLLTKHFDSSILNHMNVRTHLDNKRFDLAFTLLPR
jgi:hypothetical protein